MKDSELVFSTALTFVIDSGVDPANAQQTKTITAPQSNIDYVKVVGIIVNNWDTATVAESPILIYSDLILGNGPIAVGQIKTTKDLVGPIANTHAVSSIDYTNLNLKHPIGGKDVRGAYQFNFVGFNNAGGNPGGPVLAVFDGVIILQLEFYRYTDTTLA